MRRLEARKHLPFDLWPQTDKHAWLRLFLKGDILAGRGAGWHWAPATRRSNLRHYARWLSWLAKEGRLEPAAAPCDRVTPAVVRAYATSLQERLAPRTVASSLIGLKCVVKAIQPDGDWRWLMNLTNRLDAWALPSIDRGNQLLPAQFVFEGACLELDRISRLEPQLRRTQIAYRDALIVALLTACPIRLRNLTELRIGEHLRKIGAEWRLSFSEAETKTRRPISFIVPAALVPWLEHYLQDIRPRFRIEAGCRGMWPGSEGRPLAPETHYMRIISTTKRLFGVGINPHSFRSIAATSMAEAPGEMGSFAKALLGHSRSDTTERHYVRANKLEAGWRINAILTAIRDDPCKRKTR